MSFSHLTKHKFKYNLQDTHHPFCNYRLDIKTMDHFFLHCLNFIHQRQFLLDSLSQIDHDILKLNDLLIDTVIRKSPKYSVSINSKIFLITTKTFDGNFIRKMCDTKNSILGDT